MLPRFEPHRQKVEQCFTVCVCCVCAPPTCCAQRQVDSVHETSRVGGYTPNTFHDTSVHGALVRTKYFFNARYLWHKDEVTQPDAQSAKGACSLHVFCRLDWCFAAHADNPAEVGALHKTRNSGLELQYALLSLSCGHVLHCSPDHPTRRTCFTCGFFGNWTQAFVRTFRG